MAGLYSKLHIPKPQNEALSAQQANRAFDNPFLYFGCLYFFYSRQGADEYFIKKNSFEYF